MNILEEEELPQLGSNIGSLTHSYQCIRVVRITGHEAIGIHFIFSFYLACLALANTVANIEANTVIFSIRQRVIAKVELDITVLYFG